jgi:hypothetical protein
MSNDMLGALFMISVGLAFLVFSFYVNKHSDKKDKNGHTHAH